jgi:hypothetical protein
MCHVRNSRQRRRAANGSSRRRGLSLALQLVAGVPIAGIDRRQSGSLLLRSEPAVMSPRHKIDGWFREKRGASCHVACVNYV